MPPGWNPRPQGARQRLKFRPGAPMRAAAAVKLISLRRYLDQAGSRPEGDCPMSCAAFAGAILQRLGAGEEPDWRVDLEDLARDAGARDALFQKVLQRAVEWREGQEQREAQARREMQRLLAAFNQAVLALTEGGERAAERFAGIGQTLERASRAESLPAMRAAVYEAAEALRTASEAQRAETAAQAQTLGRKLEEARQRRGTAEPEGRGREAAIRALREAEARGGETALAAVVFDRLPALESRHGKAVAEEAMTAFELERVAGRALDGRIYAWARQMRLWLMDAPGNAEAVRERLEAALGEPFEYRTLAGGRVVMLSLEGRWMWGLLGRTKAEALIEEADLFAAGAPIRR